jgi:hypothetical protein
MAGPFMRTDSCVLNPESNPFSSIHSIAADRVAARISRDIVATFLERGEMAALAYARREIKLAICAAGHAKLIIAAKTSEV